MSQAVCTPKGAKPIWFKKKLPKSFTPLLNIPPTPCINKIMAIGKRSKKALLRTFILVILVYE